MNIFDIINVPFGYVMRFCNRLTGNRYFLALLIFAVIVEVVLLPLDIYRQKKSVKQARLRPKEMAIKKKYAGREDKATQQKMQQEMQEMYQKENFNPMSGCLPLLIQFPIIIALYNIVINPLRYVLRLGDTAINGVVEVVKSFSAYSEATFDTGRNIDLMDAMRRLIGENGIGVFKNVEGMESIASAADIPDMNLFGMNLAHIPSFKAEWWLLAVPVLTFVAYFLSMKLNRKFTYQPAGNDVQAAGCSNKIMDVAMPLLSVFITFGVPAALGVYWIFKCLLGILKQFILSKAIPIPALDEEDVKAAVAEYEVKAKKEEKEKPKSDKKVRSLHHIDDDDYIEGTNILKPESERTKPAEETEEKGTLSADAPAELKDYTRPEKKKEEEDK